MNKTLKPELSYTRVNCFLTCRRKYYFEYIEDLTPKIKSNALVTGDIVHRLLDAYYSNTLSVKDFEGLKTFARAAFPFNDDEDLEDSILQAASLFNLYVNTFEEDKMCEVRSPELHLEKDFGDFTLYSRLDGLIFYKAYNGVFRLEHKTTSRTTEAYLKGLTQGLQTGIAHWLAQELLDEPLKGSIFNLLIKTKIPKVERSAPILMNQKTVEAAQRTVYGVVEDLKKGNLYPSMQCNQYNSLCEFYPICMQNDSPAKREELYISRKEVKERAEKLNLRVYDDVVAAKVDRDHVHVKQKQSKSKKTKKEN